MRDVRIGTSGWAYRDWNGPFYPEEVKAAGRLAYISRRFRTLEINASFYRMPTDKAVAGWREQTPDDFLFAWKASRFITHNKKLKEPGAAWWVAERDGELLAFANTGPNTLPHPDARASHAELRRLYVAKAAQGLGLGTKLLAVALAWMEAHSDGPLWIGVWSGNLKAQKLYAAYGFAKAGEYQYPVGRWLDDEFILRRG